MRKDGLGRLMACAALALVPMMMATSAVAQAPAAPAATPAPNPVPPPQIPPTLVPKKRAARPNRG